MSTTHHSRTHKESGMVAILVTLILMIVISLIVLGFAQIARRNQRQSLDRQLSTQAFYAAETGVNDTANLIKNTAAVGGTVAAKTSCADNGGGFYSALPASVIDAANDVAYTCLMVDPTPTALVYSNVSTTSTIAPLVSASGTPIASIRLMWQSKLDSSDPSVNCPISITNTFMPTGNWTCGYGLLRFDLVPTDGVLNADTLLARNMAAFLVPMQSAVPSNIAYSTTGLGDVSRAACSATNCTVTINSGLGSAEYYMRITSLYRDSSLQISALDAAGTPLELANAQAVIDSTGKAQDVLRRIQVRVPLNGTSRNLLSDEAIQSTESVCKRFSVMDGSGGNPGFFSSSAGLGGPNPLCQ